MSSPVASAVAVGRTGPFLCVLSTLSPPNGSHKIVQSTGFVESHQQFPTFTAEGVGIAAGKYYYEVVLNNTNNLQVGWVIKDKFKSTTGSGNGVGDDKASWGIDGSRGKIFQANKSIDNADSKSLWATNAVVGLALDADAALINFSINGKIVHTTNLKEDSEYAPGDVLLPGASLTGRAACYFKFTADDLKHLPEGYLPLQLGPYPAEFTLDPKAEKPKEGEKPDALEDPDFFKRLIGNYAPTQNTPGADKAAKNFSELRGGFWEYGLSYHISGILSSVDKAAKAVDGNLPKLSINRSFARDVEAAVEEFDKLRVSRRNMVQWAALFLALFGQEEGARPVIDTLRGVQEKFDSALPEAVTRFRYVEGIEDRKTNKHCEYGIYYSLERFQNRMNEDRSRMSASQLESHVAELTKQADNLKGWQAWFVGKYSDVPLHKAMVDELAQNFAKFDAMFDKKAMEADLIKKSLEKADKDLDEVIRRGKVDIRDALAEFERFPERAEIKYRDLNKQIADFQEEYKKAQAEIPAGEESLSSAQVAKLNVAALVNSDKFSAYTAEVRVATENWRRAENLRLLQRAADEEMREINSSLNSGKDMVYHSRIDEAISYLHKARESVADFKKKDGALTLPSVIAFFNEYETKAYALEKSIAAWQLDRATSDATREVRSVFDNMNYLFGHYRNEEALAEYHKGSGLLKELQARTEWAQVEVVVETIAKQKDVAAKFLVDYKERVTKREAEDKIRECRGELQTARDHLDHHRHEYCLESLAKCKDLTEALKADTLLTTIPITMEWLSEYAEQHPALQTKYNKIMLQREIDNAIREANGAFGTCEDHFNHYRFEHALGALATYRELGSAIEKESRFAGHAEVEKFLGEFDKNIPAFEVKYRETMLKREYDEAIRNANSAYNEADHLFDHSRFDESLAALHKYREQVSEIKKREEFGTLGGDRDAYVKSAEDEKIPQWQEKYKTKVLGRKGDELARELRSAEGTARDHLSHYRDEHFLAALQVLKEKANEAEPTSDSPAGSDARLMFELPQVKDALSVAFAAAHELAVQFEERQLERKIDEAIRSADGPLNEANDMLNHSRFEEALTKFSLARNNAAEAASITSPRINEFSASFATRAKDFQTRYDTTIAARRLDDAVREVNSTISNAKQLFDHYRHEEALAALHAHRALIENFKDEFGAAQQAKVDAWNKDADAFEAAYRERVVTREAEEAVAKAKAELNFAEGHFDHSRFEKALESLSAARVAAGAVAVETKFKGLPVVAAFEKEFDPRVKEFNTKFQAKMEEREADERIREVNSVVNEMEQHFSHHRNEKALESYSVAQDKLTNLECQAGERFAARAEVKAAFDENTKKLAEFKKQYAERVVGNKLRESTGAALSKLNEATDMLNHHRYDEAMASAHAARELAGSVGADPMLLGLAEVDTFLKSFSEKSEALRSQITATTRARAQADAKRNVDSAMTQAKDLFSHHRHEESLAALYKAKDAVQSFSAEFGADAEGAAFIKAQVAEQAAFEKTYADTVFKQEIERKIAKAKSRLSAASDAANHYRFEEAIRVLGEADEAASLLASDERFLSIESVNTFLKEHHAATKEARAKIDSTLKQRAADEVARNAKSLLNDASRLFDHHRYEESLAAAAKVKEALENEVAAEPSLKALSDELSSSLKSFREKFQKEVLGREADSLIRGANAQLDNAEFLLSHHRNEESIEALQKARDAAASLGDDNKFSGLASVDSFFSSWPSRIQKLKQSITEKVLAKRAREAIAEVQSPLNEAIAYQDKYVYESALEKLSRATDAAQTLRGDKELLELDSVQTFLKDFQTKRDALAARIAKECYGREVDSALRSVRNHLSSAVQFFDRFAYEASLQSFSEAKDAVQATNDDERLANAESWVTFVNKEWKEQSVTFTTKYANKVLGEEVRVIAAAVRPHLAKATVFLDRNVREKAEESLNEARSAAEQLLDASGMLASLDISKAVVAELRAAQATFASKFLEDDAKTAIAASKKALERASVAEKRALDATEAYQAALEAAQPLIGELAAAPVNESFASLASVVDFVTKTLAPTLTKAGVEVFAAVAVGGKGKKGSKADTVDGILGARFPQLALLRKGLPHIPISTDVNPKYFSCLKITNQASKSAQKEFKELENNVKALTLDINAEHDERMFANQVATYPMESIERALVEFGKGLASLQQDLKDLPEKEEMQKQLEDGFSNYSTAFKDGIATLKRFDSLYKKARAMKWGLQLLKTLEEKGLSCAKFTQCPTRVETSSFSFIPGHNPFNLQYNDMPTQDSEIYNCIIKLSHEFEEKMLSWAKDFNDQFPQKQSFLDQLAAIRLKAKKDMVDHCIRQIQRSVHKPESQREYMEAMAKFPLGRQEALKRLAVYVSFINEHYSEPQESKLEDIQYSGEADPDEKPEWYLEEFEDITPSSNNPVPFGKFADQTTDASIYTAARKAVAGKIVFSKAALEENADVKGAEEKFKLDEVTAGNGIFARAFWPRALRNYALAKRRDNGAAVYGPEFVGDKHRVEFMLFVKIDGKLIERDDQALHNFSHFNETGNAFVRADKGKYKPGPGIVDFWSWNQTCRFPVLAADVHTDRKMADPWQQQAARYAYEFSKLAPGDHKVEIDLKFRVRPTDDNWLAHPQAGRKFPFTTTPISEPIASGAFTIVVPNQKVPRRSVLPITKEGLTGAVADNEKVIKAHMASLPDWGKRVPKTEIPTYVALQTEWYDSKFEWFEIGRDNRGGPVFRKECVNRGRDFYVLLKRLKKDGWKREQAAIFDLAAYGPVERNPRSVFPPITGVGVGGSYTFDLELLSEADAALQ